VDMTSRLRDLRGNMRVLLPRHRISDVGLAALPVKTVINHDNAAIRQWQGRVARDLRFAARYGFDWFISARLKPELLEDVGKRALGTLRIAFG